jgi:hypothetical protein
MKKILLAGCAALFLATGTAQLLMATSAHADSITPSTLIGKWCGAYGGGWKKGDDPLEWGRCTKSALRELLEAEGYAYMLVITDKSITINGRKCDRIGTSKWSSGYILKLKCPNGEETWRVSITGTKKSEQTITTDGAEP